MTPDHISAFEFRIVRAQEVTPELVSSLVELIPALSPGRTPPAHDELAGMLTDPRLHLLVARSNGTPSSILGIVALVFYRVPTGVRARVEDLVVLPRHRSLGIGEALMRRAIAIARAQGAHVLDLTSNPSRVEANALYQRLGFVRWDTNVYRMVLHQGG